jgi:phage major head subunit gpT-like protein
LYPGIRKAIDDGFREYSGVYRAVAIVDTTDREFFDDLDMTGVGTFAVVPEGSNIPTEDPIQGYKTRYTVKDYGKIIPITHKMMRGDLYNVNTITRLFKKLGRGANRTMDKEFWSMFNNGFDTNYTSYGDAKPLFSTVHPRKDGGTAQSNASSTGAPLSDTALFTAQNALREILDHKGQLIDIGEGKLTLIVPPALEKTAVQLTESVLDPESANNAIGYHYYRGNIDVLVCKWISNAAGGSDTAWFLVANADHMIQLITREGFETEWWEDKDNRTIKVRGTLAFAFGWSGWFGTYGSKGDNAAYSS